MLAPINLFYQYHVPSINAIQSLFNQVVEDHHDALLQADQICAYVLVEPFHVTAKDHITYIIMPVIEKLQDTYKNLSKESIFLTNTAVKPLDLPHITHIIIDTFRLYSYFQNNYNLDYEYKPLNHISNTKKFLCKFGKFNKRSSYILFCLLKDSQMFDSNLGNWSLALEDNDKYKLNFTNTSRHRHNWNDTPLYSFNDIEPYLNILPDVNYTDILNNNNPDRVFTFHYTGYPFSITEYQNTLFSIVRETTDQDYAGTWVTEKTWRPISIKHPIMLYGQPRLAQHLLDLGYRSPDYFSLCSLGLDEQDQCNISNYKNAQILFKNCFDKFINASQQNLQDIVDHNYNLYLTHVNEDINKLSGYTAVCNWTTHPRCVSSQSLLEFVLREHYYNSSLEKNCKNFDFDTISEKFDILLSR